jgi:hypothetical protein
MELSKTLYQIFSQSINVEITGRKSFTLLSKVRLSLSCASSTVFNDAYSKFHENSTPCLVTDIRS